MLDELLKFQVENKTRIEPEDRLERKWVGLIGRDYQEMVKRRSVILRVGWNEVVLTWRGWRSAVPLMATLYDNETDETPILTGGIDCSSVVRCNEGDTLSIHWSIHWDVTVA